MIANPHNYSGRRNAVSTDLGVTISVAPAPGALLVATVAYAPGDTVTTPAGWTLQATKSETGGASECEMRVYSKVADGTETAVIFVNPTAGAMVATYQEFTGVNALGMQSLTMNSSSISNAAITSNTITSVPAGAWTGSAGCGSTTSTTARTWTTSGTNWTEDNDNSSTGVSPGRAATSAHNGDSSGTVTGATHTASAALDVRCAASWRMDPMPFDSGLMMSM